MRVKPILLAGLCSIASVTAVTAATTIRITGSTAFRSATVTAIENLMGGAGNFEAVYRNTDSGVTSELNAKIAIFKGNITGANNPVTIKCAWSGSTGGVKTVAQSVTLASSWIADAELSGSNVVTAKSSLTYDSAVTADLTMSDTRQTSTKYTSPSLTAYQVGVVPFVWIKNNGAPSGLNNMTALLARAVLVGGTPLAHFTGNSADTTYVYAVGRDQDSGTRVAAFADSGFGSLSSPVQFQLNASSGAVASAELYPVTTVLGETFALGTAGYSGGGSVVAAMNLTGSTSANVYDTTNGTIASGNADILASGAHFIGYVGTSDAKSLTGHTQNASTGVFTASGELQVLTYNGVQYSFDNVREGKYTFWTYEYLMHRSNLSSDGLTVATKLRDEIKNNTASVSGIKLSTMHASRSVEGGIVSHN